MITLVCTKCATMMNVDDGFAGGVCRCSACGTIQTVPKKGEPASNGKSPGTVIYERAAREPLSKELEALGEVVTSSGIVGSGIFSQASHRKKKKPASIGKWVGIGVAAAAALFAIAYLMRQQADPGAVDPNRTSPAANGTGATGKGANGPGAIGSVEPVLKGPRFGPIVLDRTGVIVYLLDRGDATRPFTAPLQSAVIRSIASLDPTRRFQIRYWTSSGESPAFPTSPGEPSEFNRNKATLWMNEITGGQSTDAMESIDAALLQKPREIVLITGKAWQLDESFVNEAVSKLAGKDVRTHVVSLGEGTADEPLARVASKTGGNYIRLASKDLMRLGE